MQLVRSAYELAVEAHEGQMRKTGEPYIIHPIAVARIVTEELELGANPIMAAFLHDVVEDTPYTIEDIRRRFGDDVAFLVVVVTKQKKEKYDKSKQVDNYRQILASVQYDVRAILVKLADRLHNMPREYKRIERMLDDVKMSEEENLMAFVAKVNELLEGKGVEARIEVRYRTPYSIWRKMQSKGCDFHHVDDKHYIHIIIMPRVCMRRKSLLCKSILYLPTTLMRDPVV